MTTVRWAWVTSLSTLTSTQIKEGNMYQYKIACLTCDTEKSQDALETPANLTKDEVLAQAEHTPECDVPEFDVGMLDEVAARVHLEHCFHNGVLG